MNIINKKKPRIHKIYHGTAETVKKSNDFMKPEQIKKILDHWGFKVYQRECRQPSKDHYGEEITVLEEWTNEEVAKFIYDEIIKG